MITSIANTKILFFFSLLCIHSIHGSVSKYGTYVADVVEPAYVQYEMVTPVKSVMKYRTYSTYYPLYYGTAYSPYIVRELTSAKARTTQSSHDSPISKPSTKQQPFSQAPSKQQNVLNTSSKQHNAPEASSKQPPSAKAFAKRLSSKKPAAEQAHFKRFSSKQTSDSKASSEHSEASRRLLRAQERYIQNWTNYSESIPFNITLDSNAMIKNAEPFSTYLRTISYTTNSSGLVTDYMKKKGLCSGDKKNSTSTCKSTVPSSNENQNVIAPSSSSLSQESVPLQSVEIVKNPSVENVQLNNVGVGVPQSEGAYVSQINQDSSSQMVNKIPAPNQVPSKENSSPASSLVSESGVQSPVISTDVIDKDGSPGVFDSPSVKNVHPSVSTQTSDYQHYQVQPSSSDTLSNSHDQGYIVQKEGSAQSSAASSNAGYQNMQRDPSLNTEYVLVKVPTENSMSASSKVAPSSQDSVAVESAGTEQKDHASFQSVSKEQPAVAGDASSFESRLRGPGSESVYIKSSQPEKKKEQSISAFQKVLKFINPLSHPDSSKESIEEGSHSEQPAHEAVESSHSEQPAHEAVESATASEKIEYQEAHFPINIPADGDFIFYGVLFGVEGTTLQQVKFTGEPDGRVRVGIEQGEFITDAFSLSEGSPITTVWSSNGDEARLLFVNQNGKNGFFLQVDKYKLGIIDKRFLVYNQ